MQKILIFPEPKAPRNARPDQAYGTGRRPCVNLRRMLSRSWPTARNSGTGYRHWAVGKCILASAWEPCKGSLRRLVQASGSESWNKPSLKEALAYWLGSCLSLFEVSFVIRQFLLQDAAAAVRLTEPALGRSAVFRLGRRRPAFRHSLSFSLFWLPILISLFSLITPIGIYVFHIAPLCLIL